jgi:hypothetical protein
MKFCDRTVHHAKFRKAAELLGGKDAFARALTCFFAGMSYANDHRTDGFLSRDVVAGLVTFVSKPLEVAKALVACQVREGGHGLWEARDGGFYIHDYPQYQPTAEESEDLHEKRSTAGRIGGKRSGEARRAKKAALGEAPMKQLASISLPTGETKPEAKMNPGTRYPVPSTSLEEQGSGPGARVLRGRALMAGPDPRIRRYGTVNVWQSQHSEFARRLGGDTDEADRVLDVFYEDVEERWRTQGEVPAGSSFQVWQREFDARFGSKPLGQVSPRELDQARQVRHAWGRCQHDPGCESYTACLELIVRSRRLEEVPA